MISFIIPAHDEERLIGATLEALQITARNVAQPSEIIVVEDASTDQTAQIAADLGARVVSVSHHHIAATRNAGAKVAKGDILIFIDADTLVDGNVVNAAVRALQEGAVGGGAAVHLQETLSRTGRIAHKFLIWVSRVTRIAPGCFVFCTRAAFDAVGGFNEAYFAAEDVAMSRALAGHGRFVILREPVVTSARKLRTHSALEHLRLIFHLAWRGRRVLKSRNHLELWYGKRR